MSIPKQDRGQSVAVGALLILGLFVALIAYTQLAVFPNLNEEREIEAQKSAYQDILNLKSEMQSVSDLNPKSTVPIESDVSYPIQPVSPISDSFQIKYNRGVLSLDGAAYAENSSSFDKIDHKDSINAVSLIPSYKELSDSKQIVLDNTVVFENTPRTSYIRRTNQSIINGREISLYYVESNVDGLSMPSNIPISVNLKEKEEYSLTGIGNNDIEITLTTTRTSDDWKEFLETSQSYVRSVNVDEFGEKRNLSIRLDGSVNYSLTYKEIKLSTS